MMSTDALKICLEMYDRMYVQICIVIDRGIRLGDLFNNDEQIKDLLKSQMPEAREGLVEGLFESSVKLIYVSDYAVVRMIDCVLTSNYCFVAVQ